MLKINDVNVGQTVELSLLIQSAEIKFTRPPGNKPYLETMLTDGVDVIKGVDWDWGDKTPPAKNSVFVVRGPISEYMGKKQIKLVTLIPSDLGVEIFAPSGGVDLKDYTARLKALIESIKHPYAKMLVQDVFNENLKAIKNLPAAKGMHHAYVHGLIEHTVNVTEKAVAIARLTPMTNLDLVTAGALLHDMGKFWTYALNGAVIEMTDEGQLLEHIMLGAMKLNDYRTDENTEILDLILHVISSHHGELAWGSPTTPRFIEAMIIHFADNVDAKSQMVIEVARKGNPENKWTDSIWAWNNKPVVHPAYIAKVFG